MAIELNGLNSRDIALLVAVADAGSLHKASERLGLSQPGLSKAVRAIEQQLGCTLFERTPAGMCATDLGEILLLRGRQILFDLDALQTDLRNEARSNAGAVNVGAGPMVAKVIAGQVIASVQQSHPNIRIKLEAGLTDSLYQRLVQGEIDFLVGTSDSSSMPSGALVRTLQLTKPVFYVRGDHPLSQNGPLKLVDLAPYKWAFVNVPKAFGAWICARLGVASLDLGFQSDDMDVLASVVASTDMVSCASPQVVDMFCQNLNVVPLDITDIDYGHPIVCISMQTRILSRRARVVLQAIETALAGDHAVVAPVKRVEARS